MVLKYTPWNGHLKGLEPQIVNSEKFSAEHFTIRNPIMQTRQSLHQQGEMYP